MSKTGPILLIDDDADDMEIFKSVLTELNIFNELVWCNSSTKAKDYLNEMQGQPFLIVCDVNLPKQTGIEFKKEIEANDRLRRKSIPFLFYSTSADIYAVSEAYSQLTIQGFFKKEDSFTKIKNRIAKIVDYWKECEHPSDLS